MPEPKYYEATLNGKIRRLTPSAKRLRLERNPGLAMVAIPEGETATNIIFWTPRGSQKNRERALRGFAERRYPLQATVVVETAGDELRIRDGHELQRGHHTLNARQWRAIAAHFGAKRIVSGENVVYWNEDRE